MEGRFEGRRAIITGAADGMGKAMVERFRREGAKVIAADMNGEKLAAAFTDADDLRTIVLDVTESDAPDRLVGAAVDAFGGLDILINNAGVVDYAVTAEMRDDQWAHTLNVNLNAVFATCRRAIPELRKSRHGRIINLGSTQTFVSDPGLAAYAAAKHGVAGLSKTLAVELGPDGITVNYICPGATLTGMTRPIMEGDPGMDEFFRGFSVLGRMGMPEDIAAGAAFLASDDASFITGHGLVIDGGYLVRA